MNPFLQRRLRYASQRRSRASAHALSTTARLVVALLALSHTAAGQAAAANRSITLNEVIRTALERNPLIDAARARVKASRGARLTAGTLPNPMLTYEVENGGFPGHSTPVGLTREISSFSTLPLEFVWQRSPRERKADEDVRVADAEVSLARRQVAGDAARAFFRVALAQVGANAAADVQEGLDSLVRYSQARVAEGAAAEGELIRLQVERDRAATERVLQQVELVRARGALAPFVDDSTPSVGLPGFHDVVYDSLFISAVALAPARAFMARMSLRADVLAARARVAAAGAESALQRSLVVRQLGATFGTRNTAGAYSMIAGLTVPLPLFDRNRGELQRATSERVAAEHERVWVERRSSAEIAAAYESAQLLTTALATLDLRFLERAAESRRIAVAAYQEGAVPLIQVLDATRTLSEARLTYYRALFARQGSVLDLYSAAELDPLGALTMTPPPTGTPADDTARAAGAAHAPKGRN